MFQFANGNFQGLITNSSLNSYDCFLIGSYSLNSNIFTRAIEWLERSYYLSKNEFDTSTSMVRNRLQEAVLRVGYAPKFILHSIATWALLLILCI